MVLSRGCGEPFLARLRRPRALLPRGLWKAFTGGSWFFRGRDRRQPGGRSGRVQLPGARELNGSVPIYSRQYGAVPLMLMREERRMGATNGAWEHARDFLLEG